MDLLEREGHARLRSAHVGSRPMLLMPLALPASFLESVREDLGKDLNFVVGSDHPAVIGRHRDEEHLGTQFTAQLLADRGQVKLEDVVALDLVVAVAVLDPGVRVSFLYPLQGGLGFLASHEGYANGPARPACRPLPHWTCCFCSRHL